MQIFINRASGSSRETLQRLFFLLCASATTTTVVSYHHQQHQHQHQHQQQILEAQQIAEAVAAREQQEMLRTYEQQQQQQQLLVRFNSGFDAGGTVGASSFNQMTAAISPSLALGPFDNSYQLEEQQQELHRPQMLLSTQTQPQQQQPQLPQQQQVGVCTDQSVRFWTLKSNWMTSIDFYAWRIELKIFVLSFFFFFFFC